MVIRLCLAVWAGGTVLVGIAAPVVKHVLSLALVIGVFATLESGARPTGGGLAAVIAIFLAVATNVYLAMVLRPRMKYFQMKVGSFDAAAKDASREHAAPFDEEAENDAHPVVARRMRSG